MKKYFWAALISLLIFNSCNDNSVEPVFNKPILEIERVGGCYAEGDIINGKIILVPYLKGHYRAEFSGVVLKSEMPEDTLECFYKTDSSDSCLVKKSVKFYFNVKESIEINELVEKLKDWKPGFALPAFRLCSWELIKFNQNMEIRIYKIKHRDDENWQKYYKLSELINNSVSKELSKTNLKYF
ncbi:MAG: hypothetical protein GXX85_01705 [Ignavibacteria bacterium]|nr:hypothetical protein [Ignavibacteria bacterium]